MRLLLSKTAVVSHTGATVIGHLTYSSLRVSLGPSDAIPAAYSYTISRDEYSIRQTYLFVSSYRTDHALRHETENLIPNRAMMPAQVLYMVWGRDSLCTMMPYVSASTYVCD